MRELTKEQIEREFNKYKGSVKAKHTLRHYWDLNRQQEVIRKVQAYKNRKGIIRCKVGLPQCYVNKEVKVIVINRK